MFLEWFNQEQKKWLLDSNLEIKLILKILMKKEIVYNKISLLLIMMTLYLPLQPEIKLIIMLLNKNIHF
jgi:hypothetical protein